MFASVNFDLEHELFLNYEFNSQALNNFFDDYFSTELNFFSKWSANHD